MHELTAADWAGIVYTSAEQVLETMFFCPVFGKSLARLSSDAVSASLRFEGEPSGCLTIGITPAAARLLASNFLGLEPDQTRPNEVEQVTGELANMMCGNILARNYSQKSLCLSHPQIVKLTSPSACSIAVNLDIEGGLFTTYLTFDGLEIGK